MASTRKLNGGAAANRTRSRSRSRSRSGSRSRSRSRSRNYFGYSITEFSRVFIVSSLVPDETIRDIFVEWYGNNSISSITTHGIEKHITFSKNTVRTEKFIEFLDEFQPQRGVSATLRLERVMGDNEMIWTYDVPRNITNFQFLHPEEDTVYIKMARSIG